MSVDEIKRKIDEISSIAESDKISDADRVDYLSTQANLMTELGNKIKRGERSDGDKSVTIDTFKDIAKKAKDVDDFIKKTMAVKNVPPEVAKEFFDKYGKGKSQKDAALTFMKEHGNKGEANIDLKKQVKQVREGKKKEVDLPF